MITLITTLLNERQSLPAWLESILGQSAAPDEIIVVDGGSTDGTWEWLEEKAAAEPRLKVFRHPGNISSGRNFAFKMASGEIVVAADAGCVYDHDWFRHISEPMLAGADGAATGFGPDLKPEDSPLAYAIAAATTPAPQEFEKDWLPSSRSCAVKKSVWAAAGGYPEWIPICEDIVYDLAILHLGYKFSYIRKPLVFWQPRPNLRAYFRQLYKYTKGDGHGKLWLNRQLIRYGVYGGSLAMLALALAGYYWLFAALALGFAVYMEKFWKRSWQFTKQKPLPFRLAGLVLTPLVVAFGDAAKMCGWPVGVIDRRTGKIKFQSY